MHAQKRSALLIALLIGAGVAVSGCNRPNSDTAGRTTSDKYASSSSSSSPTSSTSPSTSSSSMSPTTPSTSTPSSMSATPSTTAGAPADDTALTTKVKAAILAEPGLHSMDIGVDTKDAVVTLSGTVDSPPLKERAKQVASSVSGVRSVVDNLSTKSG